MSLPSTQLVLLRLLDQTKHSQWHLDLLLDLELKSFDVADHLVDLFKDLLALFLASERLNSVRWSCKSGIRGKLARSLLILLLQEASDDACTVKFNHLSSQALQPVDLVYHGDNWLAVLVPCLCKEQKQGQAKIGALLNLDHTWTHANLDDLLDQVTTH